MYKIKRVPKIQNQFVFDLRISQKLSDSSKFIQYSKISLKDWQLNHNNQKYDDFLDKCLKDLVLLSVYLSENFKGLDDLIMLKSKVLKNKQIKLFV